jgi:lipoprotein-releasing system ATP-binding protein
MSNFLEARDVHKVFPRAGKDVEVLAGCELQLARGEAVSVVGASGSGKSTLLNILGGLDTPSQGGVFFQGQELRYGSHKHMSEWRTTGVGFVFQFHFLLPDFTALENLLIPVRGRRRVNSQDEKRARDFLDRMELSHRADHLPGELSGGEQQRVAVARAFMNRPAIVLADEPFGNLDQEIGSRLGDLLFDIRQREGTSLVIVTHDPGLAGRADRAFKLENGSLHEPSTLPEVP